MSAERHADANLFGALLHRAGEHPWISTAASSSPSPAKRLNRVSCWSSVGTWPRGHLVERGSTASAFPRRGLLRSRWANPRWIHKGIHHGFQGDSARGL